MRPFLLKSPLVAAVILAQPPPAMAQSKSSRSATAAPCPAPTPCRGKRDNDNGKAWRPEELNARKINVGGKTLKFEAVSRTTSVTPRPAWPAQKLVDSGVKYVMGPYCSGVAIPASRVYDGGGTMVSTVVTNPKVTQGGYKNVFRIVASDSQIGATWQPTPPTP